MKTMAIRTMLGMVGCVILGSLAVSFGQDKDAKPIDSADLMRKKLEISKNILEGLTTENYEQLVQNAQLLKLLTEAPAWKSPKLHDAESYPPLIQDFRRPLSEMIKQSKAKNIDGVTLAYVQMTMSCVSCHKFIREPKHKN